MEYTTHTIEHPDGSRDIVHHPILTKEEHEAAMNNLKEATAKFMRKVLAKKHEEKDCDQCV